MNFDDQQSLCRRQWLGRLIRCVILSGLALLSWTLGRRALGGSCGRAPTACGACRRVAQCPYPQSRSARHATVNPPGV